jgi:hypothetical protein
MVGGLDRIGFGYIESLEKEPGLAIAFEVGLSLNEGEEIFAFLSNLEGDPDPLERVRRETWSLSASTVNNLSS